MGAEDGGWVEQVAAGVAPGKGGGLVWRREDLGGDVVGLSGVVLADAAGHEEALEETEDGRDAGPEETEIEDAEAVAAKIEVVCAEVSEEEGEEDAEDFVFAGAFVFGEEPGALLLVHSGGVDGVDGVHGSFLLDSMLEEDTLKEEPGFPWGTRLNRIETLVQDRIGRNLLRFLGG